MRREEELQQCPLTLVGNRLITRSESQQGRKRVRGRDCFGRAQGEEEVEETPAEILYLGMLPNLSQFVVSGSHSPPPPCFVLSLRHRRVFGLRQIALLKLLLAAAPTSKAKTDSINILADVLPEEMP